MKREPDDVIEVGVKRARGKVSYKESDSDDAVGEIPVALGDTESEFESDDAEYNPRERSPSVVYISAKHESNSSSSDSDDSDVPLAQTKKREDAAQRRVCTS